jgi:alkylhydroperoxidase family enzyme
MGALDAVEWEACSLEPVHNPEAERFLRKTFGIVPPGTRYFLASPWLTRAFAGLGTETVPLRYASADLSHMVALVVSQDNSCRYCYAATRSVMRILGFPDARIRRLEENSFGADLRPSDVAALQFARCVSRATPRPCHADWQPLLAAGATMTAIVEIAFIAATNIFFNRMSTLPALPPEEVEFDRRWYARLVRPLVAYFLAPRRTTKDAVLTPAERQGPFAATVNALDGLPGASRLRAVIDDAWQSTVLERRTKAFVFAVVARGLGCQISETEARRLLVAEGEAAETIDQMLAHLSGPGVSQLDAAAATLARESIWVRPAQIQRYARSIRALFSPEQFVELLGVAALANTVCRLGIAVDIVQPPH